MCSGLEISKCIPLDLGETNTKNLREVLLESNHKLKVTVFISFTVFVADWRSLRKQVTLFDLCTKVFFL